MFNTASLSQRDPRWTSAAYGKDAGPDSTIGMYGCTLTCLTMVANGYGGNYTPPMMNQAMAGLPLNQGYGGATRNLIVFTGLPQVFPQVRFLDRVYCSSTPAPMDRVDAALAAGQPVVIQLDFDANPGLSEHWVLIYDKQGGDYLIHDPFPVPAEPGALLAQRYGFGGQTPAQIITHIVFFDGPSNPPPPPSLQLVVKIDPDIVAMGGLALRNAPSIAGALLTRLPSGTALALREPEAQARAKVGLPNQWIHVAANGFDGYVAAWLVQPAVGTPGSLGLPRTPVMRASAAKAAKPAAAKAAMQPPWKLPPLILVTNRPAKKSAAKNPPSPRLRAKAGAGGVLAELKPNTPLEVIGSSKTALKKVGVRGEWIKVRDAKGTVGYISGVHVHVKAQTKQGGAKG